MESLKQKLELLEKRNNELRPIVFKTFKTDRELDKHEKSNQKFFDEYFENRKQIEKLKLDVMTPKEKAEYEENMRLLKLKAEGKPLI